MNWLRSIGRFFQSLFSPGVANAILKGIEAAAPFVPQALNIVEAIAKATPNRTDDEIVALFKKYWGTVPITALGVQSNSDVLRDIALKLLKERFPSEGDSTLNRAIEIAYGTIKP